MNIHFGTNEYPLVPGSAIQELNQFLTIQILAEGINLIELENVLLDENNTSSITVSNDIETVQTYEGWGTLNKLYKAYNMLYWTEVNGNETIEHRADIIYITLNKRGLKTQVETNTANIEFLAIMSDIDL